MPRPGASPATPLPSATVVLVREAPGSPEVLLVRRHARASFGATYVFPGGLLEPRDRETHRYCTGRSSAEAERVLGLDRDALDYYSAAIRELFEETGVLLARGPDGTAACDVSSDAALGRERVRLNAGEVSWSEVLERHGLCQTCDALHYFAHWITPVALEKRFTTRFFVAALPAGQCARHDGGELTDSRWMTAAAALDAARAGELELPPPTRATLDDLAGFESAAAVVDWARRREADGVAAWLPAIVGEKDAKRVVMPGEPGYPHAADGSGQR